MNDSEETQVIFGFSDFWPIAHKEHDTQFHSIIQLHELAKEMFAAAEMRATEPVEKIVYVLARVTAISMNDVIMLCGNGSGTAAMKIARGMFESSLTAEYLRRNPVEATDYVDFGRVLAWRRYQWLLANAANDAKRIAPEKVARMEREYDRVKDKFSNKKGKVRYQWTLKSIGEMAEEIGRAGEYELTYSLGSSMHHVNAEGLLVYVDLDENDVIKLDAPPSMDWVTQALIFAHTDFLFALETLNDCCKLGFEDKFKAALADFKTVWKKK